jgi:hypothetical protein
MFEINELASSSSTRQDRKLNLGPRYLLAVEKREAEARRALPNCNSEEVVEWLGREMKEFRGVSSNADPMSHPAFRKAVRELVSPVLRLYAKEVISDMDGMLGYTAQALVEERFGPYTRLLEALMRDVTQVQAAKKGEAEELVGRLLEAELNWLCVDEVDLAFIVQETEKDVAASERGETAGRRKEAGPGGSLPPAPTAAIPPPPRSSAADLAAALRSELEAERAAAALVAAAEADAGSGGGGGGGGSDDLVDALAGLAAGGGGVLGSGSEGE